MPNYSESTRPLASRMPNDLASWVEAEATRRGKTPSWIIRRCVELTRWHAVPVE